MNDIDLEGISIDEHLTEYIYQFSSIQSLSRVQLFAPPWIAARQASLSITNSQSLLRFMSIESVMPSSHLILCHPLLLLPPIPPSIRVFSNESTLCMRWPKYWSFSFSIIPSKEIPGLISFRMDWLDLLVVQGTLKSLLQHTSLLKKKCWSSWELLVSCSNNSNIKDHWSHVTMTDIKIMIKFEILWGLPKGEAEMWCEQMPLEKWFC